jgi:hypothetical protein
MKEASVLSPMVACEKILKENLFPPMVNVPEELVLDFYGIEPSWYEEAVFLVARDCLLADEIVLLRARDEETAAEVQSLLDARMSAKADEARSYSPEQYAIIKKGKVLAQGKDLALLVSPDIDNLMALYQGN